MSKTSIAFSILGVIVYPFLLLLNFIIYVLHWLVSPFLFVGRVIKGLFALPIRFLAQFEALWYFLGCAILIGIFAGCVIWGIFRVFVLVFDLDRQPVPKPVPAKGHSAISYRAAREEKKRKEQDKAERRAMRTKLLASQPLIQEVVREAKARPITLSSPLSPNTGTTTTRPGLFQDIILEQTDEDSDSSFGA